MNHDDFKADYFACIHIKTAIRRKYYWLKMLKEMMKYVCIYSDCQWVQMHHHKLYEKLTSIFSESVNSFHMMIINFIIDMLFAKNSYIEKTSNAILIIINKLIKHVIYIKNSFTIRYRCHYSFKLLDEQRNEYKEICFTWWSTQSKDWTTLESSIESTARLFESLDDLLLIKYAQFTRLIESTIKNFRWLLENQLKLVKQTSQNKLFNLSLSLFASKARESVESKQSVSSNSVRFEFQINLVSLLQITFS